MYSNYLLKQAIFIKGYQVPKLRGCCTLQGCFQGRGSEILLHRPEKNIGVSYLLFRYLNMLVIFGLLYFQYVSIMEVMG